MRKRACLSIMLAVATPAVAQSTRFDAVVAAPASHHILLEDDKVESKNIHMGCPLTAEDWRWHNKSTHKHEPCAHLGYRAGSEEQPLAS